MWAKVAVLVLGQVSCILQKKDIPESTMCKIECSDVEIDVLRKMADEKVQWKTLTMNDKRLMNLYEKNSFWVFLNLRTMITLDK